MRFLILFSSAFLALNVLAQDQNFSGNYQFKNQLQWTVVLVRETVDTNSQAGKTHMAELQKAGFICKASFSGLYKCTQQNHELVASNQIKEQAMALGKDAALNFGTYRSNDLVNDAPDLKEWEYSQDLSWKGTAHNHFHIYSLKDGPVKLKISEVSDDEEGSEDDSIWFYQVSPKQWAWSQVLSETVGVQSLEYHVDILLDGP